MMDAIRDAIDKGGGQTCNIEGVLRELAVAGYVIVPKEPTKEMLDAAWASALGEDAAGVWRDMIEAALCTHSPA
jgi:hypothetical protein